jgi:lipid kinase YegS
MSAKICLIVHRKSANEEAVKAAVKTVQKEGIDLRVLVPWDKKENLRIVRKALGKGVERIIAGGGDGTINAVVNSLVGEGRVRPKTTLGIMPLGTANDFARGCGLPLDDLTECLRIACTRAGRPTDVGKMNKRYFINVASAGFGAEVTATTPIELKKALGGGAYTLMGIVKAFQLSPYTGRLLVPGEEPVTGDMLFMAVGNNRFAGGGFEVANRASVDDGLLDLAVVSSGGGFSPAQLAAEIKDPMNPENTSVYYRQLAEFTIEADQKLHCNLDGEPVLKRQLNFSILPRHIKVAY